MNTRESLLTFVALWTLANAIDGVNARLTVRVLAHEVERGQTQVTGATITCLLVVEIYGCLFHASNFASAGSNPAHLVVQPRVVLVNPPLLRLQILKDERLQYSERHVLVALKDLNHEQGWQNVFLPDLL